MKWVCCIVASLLLAFNLAAAQAPAVQGPPPTFTVVSKTIPAKGQIVLTQIATAQVPVLIQEKALQGNVEVVVTKTIFKQVFVEKLQQIDATTSRIIDRDGKQLVIDEVWKRLQPNTVLALSGDSNAPAPAYLRALSAATLVLIPGPTADTAPALELLPAPKK